MAFINIKTEWKKGGYGTKKEQDSISIEEIYTSGILDNKKEIVFLKPNTLIYKYWNDMSNTTIEDIEKPFSNSANKGERTFNTPADIDSINPFSKNIRTEYTKPGLTMLDVEVDDIQVPFIDRLVSREPTFYSPLGIDPIVFGPNILTEYKSEANTMYQVEIDNIQKPFTNHSDGVETTFNTPADIDSINPFSKNIRTEYTKPGLTMEQIEVDNIQKPFVTITNLKSGDVSYQSPLGIDPTIFNKNIITEYNSKANTMKFFDKTLGIDTPFIQDVSAIGTEQMQYNTPIWLSGNYAEAQPLLPNLELEYISGASTEYFDKVIPLEAGFGGDNFVGDFIEKTTKDVLWMAKYLDPTGPNFFGETGAFQFLLNQQFLQTFNARTNTKIYNPLSLFKTSGTSPMYQLPPFIDIVTDFPFGNHQYSKWMEDKITAEKDYTMPAPPDGFTKFINDVVEVFGIPNDNKTLFERYIEDTGVSSQLSWPKYSPINPTEYNSIDLFYNKTAHIFKNPWTSENKFPKVITRKGSPWLKKVDGDDVYYPSGNNFGSKLTDWILYYNQNWNELLDFTENWPKATDVDGDMPMPNANVNQYFAYDYEQISKVVSGSLPKYSDESYRRPEGSENMVAILNKPQTVNYGYSKYVKNLDWRSGSTSIVGKENELSIKDAVDNINMIDYGDKKLDQFTGDLKDVKDLIPFKIYDIANNKWIIFRSFITGLTDNPSSEWSEKSYVGRPDKVYVYAGASREFNFSLKVMAFSLVEMKPLYRKLNYLIGLQYPHMDDNNKINPRMIAPFVKLTIGSILKNTYGYFSSLNITYPEEFPWELGGYKGKLKKYDVQLPMGFEITFTFKVVADELLHSKSKHIFGLPNQWID